MVKCVNYGFQAEDKFNFCPNCGSALVEEKSIQEESLQSRKEEPATVYCEICGEITNNKNGYCENCGAKLTGNEKITEPDKNIIEKTKVEQPKISKDKIQEKQKTKSKGTKSKEQKKKEPASENKKKNLSKGQLILIIIPILIGIVIVLWASGVFKTNKDGNSDSGNNGTKPEKIDLSQIQVINDLEKVVKSDTTNSVEVLELAHKLNDSGFFERAIEYYQMYLRSNPKNVDARVDLGVCYFELKKFDLAKSEMRKGLSINPRHQIGLFNLGIVNFSQGNLDSAKLWWKKSVEIDESTDIAKKAKQLIESN